MIFTAPNVLRSRGVQTESVANLVLLFQSVASGGKCCEAHFSRESVSESSGSDGVLPYFLLTFYIFISA